MKATSRAEPRLEFSRLSARLGSNSAHLRAARLGSKFEKNRRLGSARIFEIQNGSAQLGSAHIFAVCILDSNPVFVHGHTNAYIHIIYTHTTHLTRISTHTYIRVNACTLVADYIELCVNAPAHMQPSRVCALCPMCAYSHAHVYTHIRAYIERY